MTKEEYDKQVKDLETEFQNKVRDLCHRYAKENNPYNIGDTISDNIGTIVITKLRIYRSPLCKYPSIEYTGTILNKNGKPNKRLETRTAYQQNIISSKENSNK